MYIPNYQSHLKRALTNQNESIFRDVGLVQHDSIMVQHVLLIHYEYVIPEEYTIGSVAVAAGSQRQRGAHEK